MTFANFFCASSSGFSRLTEQVDRQQPRIAAAQVFQGKVGMQPNFIIAGGEFPLSYRNLKIGGLTLRQATIEYSEQELQRIVGLRGLREKTWPYWLEEWPATYAMGDALSETGWKDISGPVLDLGCGNGMLSAFMEQRFGCRIFSCDFNFDACRLTALNRRSQGKTAAVFCGDLNAFPSRKKFRLILAGDMLYLRTLHAPLIEFLRNHLEPDGEAWFADHGRSTSEGFLSLAEQAGFQLVLRAARSRSGHGNAQVYILKNAEQLARGLT